MITKVWLIGKTKGEDAIEYPNCYPFFSSERIVYMWDIDKGDEIASHLVINIARIEFRPK